MINIEKMTLTEIAAEILRYLHKFEMDSEVNKQKFPGTCLPYYHPDVRSTGQRIKICYRYFEMGSFLSKSVARAYLDSLRAGEKRKHYEKRL